MTDAESVIAAKAALTFSTIKGLNLIENQVKYNLVLGLAGIEGTTISWVSSVLTSLTNAGVVTRSLYAIGSISAVLTATITKGIETDTKVFNLTIYRLDANIDDLQTSIYNWISYTLNTLKGFNVPVVYGSEDFPQPKTLYLVIHQPFTSIPQDNYGAPDTEANGIRKHYAFFEHTVSIEEVNGNGKLLVTLQKSLEWESVGLVLATNNIVVRRFEGIVPIPQLFENKWQLRSVCDFHVANIEIDEDNTSYIEDVEYTRI